MGLYFINFNDQVSVFILLIYQQHLTWLITLSPSGEAFFLSFFLYYYYHFFGEILVPCPGIEPVLLAVEMWHPNNCTARDVPEDAFIPWPHGNPSL